MATLVIGLIPPLRQRAAAALSRAVLVVLSPFAPDTRGFQALPATTRLVAADGSALADLNGTQRREPVALASLPPQVAHAVLAAEDANFYHDAGIDPTGIVRAAINDVRGKKVQGGSTIDQQLAKLNYTGGRRSVFRKLAEVLYVAKLEHKYSKNELLERYLNQVYFGDGAYGISAAAQTYFGVPPEQLTAAQAATVAGKIRAPERLDPRSHPHEVTVRRDEVLRSMHKRHWLTKADLKAALATPVSVIPAVPAAPSIAPHFVQYVEREAAGLDVLGATPEARASQLFTGGYTIETTIDPKVYNAASAAVKNHLGAPGDPAAAVVSIQPGDGAIRSLFGGLNFDQHQFDPASQGLRQPGSSWKVFDYLAMLGDGVDPRSILPAPQQTTVNCAGQPPYQVHNFEGEAPGWATVDDALAQSVNTVFAELVAKVGPDNVMRAAESAGIPPRNLANCAVALGGLSKGVSPLEMAAAYATFAAKGIYAQPYSITTIKDRHGNVIYTHAVKTRPAFDSREVGVLTSALTGVVNHGTGVAANIGRPVAGKTGTTENYGDAWFVGYVPQLATAAWVGYVNGVHPMTNVHGIAVAGGTYPAQIFADTMKAALDGVPPAALFTATPDQLSLHILLGPPPGAGAPPPPGATTTTSTTAPSNPTPAPTAPPPPQPAAEPTTVARPSPTTTAAPRSAPTSTSTSSTSTTIR